MKALGKINAQFLKQVFKFSLANTIALQQPFVTQKEPSEFFCKDSESSEESEEEGEDPSPWLSLWQPYNPWHKSQVAQKKFANFKFFMFDLHPS